MGRRLLALAVALMLAGCNTCNQVPLDPKGVCAGDRCYIEDADFVHADRLYDEYGTLALVSKHLKETDEWHDAQINEAIYRIRKVHGLP